MKFKDVLIVILILVIGWFLLFGSRDGKNTHTTDVVEHHSIDTIVLFDTVELKRIELDTVYETKRETLIEYGTYPINKYEFKVNDSLLDGVIIATSPFKPLIDFKYTVKSFKIKDSIVIKRGVNYSGFLYGGSVVVSPLASEVYFDLARSFKNGNQMNFSIGRDLDKNKTLIKVGFLKKF